MTKVNQAYLDYFKDNSFFRLAKTVASDWHSGQWSALYQLSCGFYALWTEEDLDSMINEFQELIDDERIDHGLSAYGGQDYDSIVQSITMLKNAKELLCRG